MYAPEDLKSDINSILKPHLGFEPVAFSSFGLYSSSSSDIKKHPRIEISCTVLQAKRLEKNLAQTGYDRNTIIEHFMDDARHTKGKCTFLLKDEENAKTLKDFFLNNKQKIVDIFLNQGSEPTLNQEDIDDHIWRTDEYEPVTLDPVLYEKFWKQLQHPTTAAAIKQPKSTLSFRREVANIMGEIIQSMWQRAETEALAKDKDKILSNTWLQYGAADLLMFTLILSGDVWNKGFAASLATDTAINLTACISAMAAVTSFAFLEKLAAKYAPINATARAALVILPNVMPCAFFAGSVGGYKAATKIVESYSHPAIVNQPAHQQSANMPLTVTRGNDELIVQISRPSKAFTL